MSFPTRNVPSPGIVPLGPDGLTRILLIVVCVTVTCRVVVVVTVGPATVSVGPATVSVLDEPPPAAPIPIPIRNSTVDAMTAFQCVRRNRIAASTLQPVLQKVKRA